jgi:hypothetical protein
MLIHRMQIKKMYVKNTFFSGYLRIGLHTFDRYSGI